MANASASPKRKTRVPRTKRAAKNTRSSKGGRPNEPAKPVTKLAVLQDLLRRRGGATIDDLVEATGWQPHSVRGTISGTLKKKRGLEVISEKVEGRGRVYRIGGQS